MAGKTEQITVRLDPELLALVDEVGKLAGKLSALEEPPRATVLRTAMRRGLELMRSELKAKLAGKRQ